MRDKAMEKLKEILNEVLDAGYEDCDDYIEAGVMDSLQVMDLVEALEAAYDIEISGRDILPENFSNIDKIQHMLTKYGVEI